jgi:WD40 repeat protein
VRLYDVKSGQPEDRPDVCNTPANVTAIQYNANGNIIAVGDVEGNVIFCYLLDRSTVISRRHYGRVNAVGFDANRATGGNVAISCSTDSSVIVWDVGPGTPIRTINEGRPRAPIRWWASVEDASVHVNDEGVIRVVYGTLGGSVIMVSNADERSVDLERMEHVTIQENYIQSVKFHPSGETVAIGRKDGTITLRNVTGNRARQLDELHQLQTLCFSPDGLMLASGDDEGVVRIWDIGSGEMVGTIAPRIAGLENYRVHCIDIVTDNDNTPVLFCGFDGAFFVRKGPLDWQKTVVEGKQF